MAREDPQMKLRLPEQLRDQVAEAAGQNGRSLNAEIVKRLEWSFKAAHLYDKEGTLGPATAEQVGVIVDGLRQAMVEREAKLLARIDGLTQRLVDNSQVRLEQERKGRKSHVPP